ncbi:putative P-loop containing nucleoside triphosphate hydrolase, leucine-rich repeat domain superfamily [Helianthus debilis subsp. tardiflorus]
MDSIISSIITPVVESLMLPVKKHLGFLVSSTKHVKDMKDEMDQLNITEQDIQEKKTTADANYHVVSRHVSPWLEDVQKMKEKVESIPTDGIGCFHVAKRYKAGKQSCIIVQQIKALKERASEISWTNERKPLAKVPSTSAPVPHGTQTTTFESRDSVFNAALQSLQSNDESQKMIALCGMGGVGKTTMMEQLKKAVEDSKMFDWVVKVVLGESSDPFVLQQAVAEYIHQDLTEKTIVARAELLCKKFEGMSQNGQKKILAIMDDIWKEVDLKDVGLTSPLPNGFKLLFTSRFEYVCTQMGVRANSIFRVRVLNEAEAKSLFFEIVGLTPSDGNADDLQKIGEDIVNKCGGLPIALKTIANSLNGNIKEVWKQTLFNLQHDDLQDLNEIVHKIFEMSYNNLKKEDDKSIFLLSGLFPDDFDIPIEDLMRYVWGLKLFTKVHTLRDARRRTIICVNNLLRANLLTESECMGCVKMHDLVRVFALSNFSKIKQASRVYHVNMSGYQLIEDAKESYERILLKCTGISKFPVDFNYPNLSLLIVMDGNNLLKFPQDIHEKSEKLEVVCYEKMGIPLLPIMFKYSTNLRTLCLRSCSLTDDISFLGGLCNLETLTFAYCHISRLPSGVGKLKKLKLLEFTKCGLLYIDEGVFRDLDSLEELYIIPSSNIRFTHGNCEELENLSSRLFALELEFFNNNVQPRNVSFKNLERFRISVGCKMRFDEKYSFRNTLNLETECDLLQNCSISNLFEETEELHLQVNDMNQLENVSMEHSFSNLKFLYVHNCKKLTYLFTVDMASGLKKLERLEISNCPVMRTLVDEDCTAGVIRFPKLNYMSLDKLPSMVSLCETVIELPEMVELKLGTLPSFTSIYPDNNSTCAIPSLLNKKVVIPKLEKLHISKMENLKQIWPCQISTDEKTNVSTLRMLSVDRCGSLVNLFPNNPLPTLNNLEKLGVSGCDSIEVIFNIDSENVSEMEGYLSRLRSITVEHSGKIKELWRMRGVNNSNILINGFQAVQSIYISDCKRFESIFTPVTANFDLSALTHYNTDKTNDQKEMDITYPSYLLHKCHHVQRLNLSFDERVEVVFEMDSQPPLLLPYLQSIHLEHLKKIRHVWKCNWNKFLIRHHPPLRFPFQNLTTISLQHCDKIKYLFSPLMAKYLSNLKSVTIAYCDSLEEVISRRDDEKEAYATSASCYEDATFLPHLDTLMLERLGCLKSVDDSGTTCRSDKLSPNMIHDEFQSGQVTGASWSLCRYPQKIYINYCPSLSSLIPRYAVGQMKKLQELKIGYCKGLMEVFESESSRKNVDEGAARVVGGPPLKNITIIGITQLSNLKKVLIEGCDLLPHIFTFSTVESLNQLKELKVTECRTIHVIVKEEKETSSKDVVFPRLETLELGYLPNLTGFFIGMNDFRWPSLDNVLIKNCPQLMMFTSGQSTTPKLKYIETSFGKYSPECGLNFHETFDQTTLPNSSSDPSISKGVPFSFNNLIEINIKWRYVGRRTIIPSHALLQLEMLQQIHLWRCEEVTEVFEVVASEGTNGSSSNASKTVVKIPNLTQVKLDDLDDLKYLWKSNQWMVLEFSNLTTLSIDYCKNLEHVFTCSMVGSLVQLQDLSITHCNKIEVIVKEEEEEEECDAKVNQIILPHLNSLKLDDLSRLKGFCLGNEAFSLPALDTLLLKRCPTVTVFTKGHMSTPELKVIDTSFGFCYVKTNINTFIKTRQEEGCEF